MKKMQNIKGKLLSNQIATHNTKEKKAGLAELARKLDTNVCVLFAALKPFLSFCSLSTPPLNNRHTNQWYPTLDLDDEGRRFFLPDVTVVDVGKCFPPVIGGVKSGSGLRFAASSLRGLPRFFFSCKHQHKQGYSKCSDVFH